MELERIRGILEATALGDLDGSARDVCCVYGSDLMSDVLTTIKCDALLLTGLTNVQVVRTAEMSDIGAVCFVGGKTPDDSTIQLAVTKGLPLLSTKLSMYESCARLHEEGLPGCD